METQQKPEGLKRRRWCVPIVQAGVPLGFAACHRRDARTPACALNTPSGLSIEDVYKE